LFAGDAAGKTEIMGMRPIIDRAVFTIARTGEGWNLEHEGAVLESSAVRQDMQAAASKYARASQEAGRPAQICDKN